jgi:hypothetical protein
MANPPIVAAAATAGLLGAFYRPVKAGEHAAQGAST